MLEAMEEKQELILEITISGFDIKNIGFPFSHYGGRDRTKKA